MRDKENCFQQTINKIDNSLFPLIFQTETTELSEYFFSAPDLLVTNSETIIKFSSLLIQIYWLKITAQKEKDIKKDFISPELDRILKQIWAGHSSQSCGYANSILHYVAIMDKNTTIGKLVRNPNILIKWNEIISIKEGFYKKYEELLSYENIPILYISLLESLPFLRLVSYKEDKFIFKDFNHLAIDSFPFLRFFKEDYTNPLYLLRINQKKESVILTFEEPHDSQKFEIEISPTINVKDFEKFSWINEIMGFENVKNISESLTLLFDGNYIHIQNIAKAISIKTGHYQEIIDYVADTRKKYGEISPVHSEDILTLIIADYGPAKVLRDILCKNRSFLKYYLEYFESKGSKNAKYWESKRKEYVEEKRKNIQDIVGLEGKMKEKIEEKIEDESYIWCMLNAAGSKQKTKEPFVDSINRRKKSIQKYKREWDNLSEEEIKTRIHQPLWTSYIWERTLKFLILFYSAIGQIYSLLDNETEDKQIFDIDNILPEIQGFIEKEYSKIHNKNLTALLEKFMDDILLDNSNYQINRSLKRFLGRDMDYFMKDDNIKKNLQRVWKKIDFNWSKHDHLRIDPRKLGSESLGASEEFCHFLQFGDFNIDSSIKHTLFPIYPMIISFREAHRNREGMNIYYYEIYSFEEDEHEQSSPIKILTEQKYYQNEEYYCIPNIKRSSKDWWIDPFLIQCSKFDETVIKLRKRYGT